MFLIIVFENCIGFSPVLDCKRITFNLPVNRLESILKIIRTINQGENNSPTEFTCISLLSMMLVDNGENCFVGVAFSADNDPLELLPHDD